MREYGNEHKYEVGDSLKWLEEASVRMGKRNAGQPGHPKVVVDGCAERCPECHFEVFEPDSDFRVCLLRDVIIDVIPATGQYDFRPAAFIVLDQPPAR
jgi:hypothetical protein